MLGEDPVGPYHHLIPMSQNPSHLPAVVNDPAYWLLGPLDGDAGIQLHAIVVQGEEALQAAHRHEGLDWRQGKRLLLHACALTLKTSDARLHRCLLEQDLQVPLTTDGRPHALHVGRRDRTDTR